MSSLVLAGEKEASDDTSVLITFYQKVISPIDGDRCPMEPSCSLYLNQAIKKHGYFLGWIMGMDRIVRCGRSEVNVSLPIWKNGIKHTHDPVENNDFWWSDR
jgi:putative component of membrane protein insertase Oxa1/YidC/SpoIIIJ protein YidD